MASSAAARKAWNDAMKATAGASLPQAARKQKRRSDRHKKQDRRSKARKMFQNANENEEFRTAVWVDALEGIDPSTALTADDDEEYDELDDLDDDNNKKKKRGSSRRSKGQKKAGVMPKRFLPRPLSSFLVEDANRVDGAARAFLAAEAHVPADQQLPRRKFCPVTGLEGIYTEPKSGIPYSSMKALEQIRERAPPWMSLSGAATYHEAVKSIEDS